MATLLLERKRSESDAGDTMEFNIPNDKTCKDGTECSSSTCAQYGCQWGNPNGETAAHTAEQKLCRSGYDCQLKACETGGCQDTSGSIAEGGVLPVDVERVTAAAPMCAALALQPLA